MSGGGTADARPRGNGLPAGYALGEFRLERSIGEGGFGIVYLAWDESLQRKVALKEYMPSELARRMDDHTVVARSERHRGPFEAGLRSFINEARALAQFDHPALVKVYRFWEANGTAYMVMPFYEGVTLREKIGTLRQPPDEDWLMGLLAPLTEALAVIHAGRWLHRDIAPDNVILLAGDERPLLLDFGAARHVISDMTHALTVILKPGYAPVEQYAEIPGLAQGPWTDVYALGATVYWMIVGAKPPVSVGRLVKDSYVRVADAAAGRYSAGFLSAIDRTLAVQPQDRTPDIAALRADLGLVDAPSKAARSARTTWEDPDATVLRPSTAPADTAQAPLDDAEAQPGFDRTSPAAAVVPPRAAEALPRRGRSWVWGGAVLAALGAAAAGVLLWRPAPVPVAHAPDTRQATAPAAGAVPEQAPATGMVAAPASPPFTVLGEFGRVIAGQSPGFEVEVLPATASLRVQKDELRLKLTSTKEGFYYVLSLEPDGKLLMLWPNAKEPKNRINPGRPVTVPSREAMVAAEPAGKGTIIAIVSSSRRDFSALSPTNEAIFQRLPTGPAAAEIAARQGVSAPSIYVGVPDCGGRQGCDDRYGAAMASYEVVR